MEGTAAAVGDQDVQISIPSTLATPITPAGLPFFIGYTSPERGTSINARESLPIKDSSNCFGLESWASEDGSIPTLTCPLPPSIPLSRKVGAEFLGTLILIFALVATPVVNEKTNGSLTLLGFAVASGLAVMVIIIATGHISGAHLNPSVTIAFAALRHFPWKHVPMYIGAQVLGSICGAFMVKEIFQPALGGGVTVPTGTSAQAFALEFLTTFILMFVVTAVATDTRAAGELAAITVGATVMLNVLIAGGTSGASMNPVRTLAPAIATNNFRALWIYITAPTLGALCGAGIYTLVKLPEENDENNDKASLEQALRR